MAIEVKQPQSDVETEQLATGCEAIAEAIRLADVDVMAAYPIRPYDGVMQAAAKLIANGKMDVEYIVADGEHSQFEIVKHASAVGSRVFVGSSGVGWFYAFEAIAVTAGLRLPVVAICGNRALDDPGAFGCEHNDALAVRDLGWLLCWAETAQESLDFSLMCWRVAEDKRVMLPAAIGLDGAFLTHSQQIVKIPTQAAVNAFLPKYDLGDRLLHPDNPITIAPQVDQDWLMEIRRQNDAAMRNALGVITEAHGEFKRLFGRGGENPFLDEYMTDDAEVVFLGQGTLSLPMKVAIRRLRKQGHKVGLVRLKWFRPFPTEDIVRSLTRFKAVGVIDRDYSFGSPYYGGVLYNEIRSALYSQAKRPVIVGFIAALGGREIEQPMANEMFEKTVAAANGDLSSGDVCHWIGVRQ
ncbi:MAG TPA: pyruvate ferredoxin oxidoreductase [Candidatus Limnocylindria bacterium]|nr:pyruvate ferredoxin oxidoreductase [Candidatus Limnocylindria bacterium]